VPQLLIQTLVALVAIFCVSPAHVQEAPDPEWRSLHERVDFELQSQLERRLDANSEWRRLIQRGHLAVGVVDLGSPSNMPRFARVNGNQMMYAASLPKIAVLLAAYVSFEDGTLKETPAVRGDLQNMIRFSNNAAATRMIDAVGMDKIERVVRDPQFGFYDEKLGGGLWVGKRYAATGPRYGDPVHDMLHGATVTQVARFYYELAAGRLIDARRSAQMLEDLADSEIHHAFVAAIEERAPAAKIYRKSGTWRQWHSDSALVRDPDWRNYILVALVESPNGEAILRNLVPMIEDILVQKRRLAQR
jgi:beta-lactamase class A